MRRSGLFIVGLITVNAALLLLLVWKERPSALLAEVKDCFGQLPNVAITEISKPPQEFFDTAAVTLAVSGKGEIGFSGVRGGSFRRSSHIHLYRIGGFEFRTRTLARGQESYGYDIDIGINSPVPEIRALRITSIGRAISHYDDLLAIISTWPKIHTEWPSHWPPKPGKWSDSTPEEVHFPHPPKTDYFFCLKE